MTDNHPSATSPPVRSGPRIASHRASDGYPIRVAIWPVAAAGTIRGRVVVIHGVQSHGGWYHGLGRRLAEAGYEAHFPDRRGSGANQQDRGHAPSARRLIHDLAEYLQQLRQHPHHGASPIAVAGISWGGKLAVLLGGDHPDRVDALVLICPGLHPRVGVSRREQLQIGLARLLRPRKRFLIPLSDPALFTANPNGQAFIAADPLSLHHGTASLMVASTVIDRRVRRAPQRVHQPVLLMLAGQDRIVDNAKTRLYFERLASVRKTVIEYPEAHHTLEFEPDPARYAHDLISWLHSTMVSPRLSSTHGHLPADAGDRLQW